MSATTVLVQSLYQGTIYSSPLPWPAGATTVNANGLLSDQDGQDSTKRLTLAIETSTDGGQTYQQNGPAVAWVGGQPSKSGGIGLPNVGISYGASQSPPDHVRVRLELPGTLSVGASVTFS